MSTAVCLQVRLDSSRLPGKALLKIEDLTIVEHAMRALKGISVDKHLLVTTSDSVTELEPLSLNWGFVPFAGPKDDVLLRFLQAARHFKIKTIIRATGDNPLVSAKMASEVLDEHLRSGAEYTNWIDAPLGTGIEVVETEALERSLEENSDSYCHEHVTPGIYRNPDRFRLNIHPVPEKYFFKEKVSVDTPEDLEKMKRIFSALYRNKPIEIEALIDFLKKEEKSE